VFNANVTVDGDGIVLAAAGTYKLYTGRDAPPAPARPRQRSCNGLLRSLAG